jgi:hypothetical protein
MKKKKTTPKQNKNNTNRKQFDQHKSKAFDIKGDNRIQTTYDFKGDKQA